MTQVTCARVLGVEVGVYGEAAGRAFFVASCPPAAKKEWTYREPMWIGTWAGLAIVVGVLVIWDCYKRIQERVRLLTLSMKKYLGFIINICLSVRTLRFLIPYVFYYSNLAHSSQFIQHYHATTTSTTNATHTANKNDPLIHADSIELANLKTSFDTTATQSSTNSVTPLNAQGGDDLSGLIVKGYVNDAFGTSVLGVVIAVSFGWMVWLAAIVSHLPLLAFRYSMC